MTKYQGPEMTPDEFYALRQRIAEWLRIKAQFDQRWPQRWALVQLSADVEHSSLLMRMLLERKDPLPEPPPLKDAYPVYLD